MGGITDVGGERVLVTIGDDGDTDCGTDVMVPLPGFIEDEVDSGSAIEGALGMLLLGKTTGVDGRAELVTIGTTLDVSGLGDTAGVIGSCVLEYKGVDTKLGVLLVAGPGLRGGDTKPGVLVVTGPGMTALTGTDVIGETTGVTGRVAEGIPPGTTLIATCEVPGNK